jgi:hypothetical protein
MATPRIEMNDTYWLPCLRPRSGPRLQPGAEAPGSRAKHDFAPEGPTLSSVPEVLWFVINFVFFEKDNELRLECQLPVMFGLIGDVFFDFGHNRATHRKCAVTSLPMEFTISCLMPPQGRIRFDITDQIGHGQTRRVFQQHMHVIGHPAHRQQDAASIIQYPTNVGIQVRCPGWLNQRLTVFGAENDMREKIRQGGWHRRPLRGGSWDRCGPGASAPGFIGQPLRGENRYYLDSIYRSQREACPSRLLPQRVTRPSRFLPQREASPSRYRLRPRSGPRLQPGAEAPGSRAKHDFAPEGPTILHVRSYP